MRVAWVTHQTPKATRRGKHFLPGRLRGGAEMSTADMASQAPDHVTVTFVAPGEVLGVEADRIVVTGTELLSDEEMTYLSRRNPVVWPHNVVPPSRGRAALFENADPFLALSPAHLDHERRVYPLRKTGVQDVWMDTSLLSCRRKEPFALWANRRHPLKGLPQARMWAEKQGVHLEVMYDRPRREVLEVMSRASWYVFLPKELDVWSRGCYEAHLSGCEVVTNSRCGFYPDRARERVEQAAVRFWSRL